MPNFVPGLTLSHSYYNEVVAPLLAQVLPNIRHAAGLIGDGSEVLGFDTERSSDHDWGPRVQIFFDHDGIDDACKRLVPRLATQLPAEFEGFTTQYHRGDPSLPSGPWRWGEIVRGVEVHEVGHWATTYLGSDPRAQLDTGGWLSLPWCLLRGATDGAVWRDDGVGISAIRDLLRWYPDDLWRYVVACQWQRINQEEPFVGRTVEAGADLGSRIIISRQIRELMHLCFLLERTYPPYIKWLDTAFRRLDCAADILPLLVEASTATDMASSEAALAAAYVLAAHLHNRTKISAEVEPSLQQFHDRPYRVLNSYRFVEAMRDAITDPGVRTLPLHGAISQCVDSTDVLSSGAEAHRFADVLGLRGPNVP